MEGMNPSWGRAGKVSRKQGNEVAILRMDRDLKDGQERSRQGWVWSAPRRGNGMCSPRSGQHLRGPEGGQSQSRLEPEQGRAWWEMGLEIRSKSHLAIKSLLGFFLEMTRSLWQGAA